jgi:hypothetical protein
MSESILGPDPVSTAREREARAAAAMFGGPESQQLAVEAALRERVTDDAIAGLSADTRAEIRTRGLAMLAETGLEPSGLGQRLIEAHAEDLARDARGRPDPDEAATQRAQEDGRQRVFAVYGVERGEALIARVQQFVQAHPRLAEMVSGPRVGNDPALLAALVDHVHRTNWRPAARVTS